MKAIACALPHTQGVPLSRFSRAELQRLVVERGTCEASASTIARWLAEDAIKPWRYRSLRSARAAGDDEGALCLRPPLFWIVDNGSAHRGQASIERIEGRWRNLVLVHLPLHASWLNQIEIVQRKLLQPNDFGDLATLARTLNEFEHHYNEVAEPFDWRFTRRPRQAHGTTREA